SKNIQQKIINRDKNKDLKKAIRKMFRRRS
ncbi:MAG: hypothetical protein ACI8RD_010912, partial [Bacillariaceae sp.]